jgi:hypothetical protein
VPKAQPYGGLCAVSVCSGKVPLWSGPWFLHLTMKATCRRESIWRPWNRLAHGLDRSPNCGMCRWSRCYGLEPVDQEAFEQFTEKIFATDRDLVPKGMIEVMQWALRTGASWRTRAQSYKS